MKTAQLIVTVVIEGELQTYAYALDPSEGHASTMPLYCPRESDLGRIKVEFRPDGRSL